MFTHVRHRRTIRPRYVVAAVLAAATAQAATPQERRDQLAQVQELLADPDPAMRLANMEQLLATGDGTRIQRALRIAFSSDDAELRSLAMRAYIANLKQLTLDITPPEPAEKALAAANDEPSQLAETYKRYPYVQAVASIGFRFTLTFQDYNLTSNTGKLTAYQPATFIITGDRFTSHASIKFGGNAYDCGLDLRPTNTLRLEGSMACATNPVWPRLKISAPLF